MIRFTTSDTLGGQVPLAVFDGYGYLPAEIPSTGDSGPSVLYNDQPTAGNEYLATLVSPPAAGVLAFNWDGSFSYTGPSTTFTYQLYENGVAIGSPALVTLQVGASGGSSGAIVMVWSGSAWVAAIGTYVYNGTGWVPAQVSIYNGTGWT